MAGKKWIHWKRAKHVAADVRRDRRRQRHRSLLRAALQGGMAGPFGVALFTLLIVSPMIPNPRFEEGLQPGSAAHASWLPAAEAMPQDKFYEVFRIPSMGYARRLARSMQLPTFFQTSQRYKASGLEGLLLLHARLGSSGKWADLRDREPFTSVPRSQWSTGKMSAVFTTVSKWVDHHHGSTAMWSNSTFSPARAHVLSAHLQAKGCPLPTVIGFVDGTCRPTCRPGDGQRAVYNGYVRCPFSSSSSPAVYNGYVRPFSSFSPPAVYNGYVRPFSSSSSFFSQMETEAPFEVLLRRHT